MTFGNLFETGRFKLQRSFKPFWGDLEGFSEEDIK
jgi:hypothetical protein